MAATHPWSVALVSNKARRVRWLAENGRFTSDPEKALRLLSPEVAARRVQTFMEIHGWEPEVMERFQLVPAPETKKTDPRSSRRAASRPGKGNRDQQEAA